MKQSAELYQFYSQDGGEDYKNRDLSVSNLSGS